MILLHNILIILAAIVYSQVSEWFIHKYILHGLGKNKKSPWAFHWHAHHKKSRKNNFYDEDYLNDWTGPPLKEKIGLMTLVSLHIPICLYSPVFFITIAVCAIRYYMVHKYAHMHPSWARDYLRCHYDHHMGKNQDMNWGVTTSWVDKMFRSREIKE